MSGSTIWPNAPPLAAGVWNGQPPQVPAVAASSVNPPPSKKYARIPLRTISEVQAEAGRVYRLARSGQMDSAECSRLASVLALIARMIEGGELERRLEQLEERM